MYPFFPYRKPSRIMRNGRCVGVVTKSPKDLSNIGQGILVKNGSVRDKDGGTPKSVIIGSSRLLSSDSQPGKSDNSPIANPQCKIETESISDQLTLVEKELPEPRSATNDDLKKELSTLKQNFKKLHANVTNKTPDSLHISDLGAVKSRIYDMVCHLGQETLTAQDAIRRLLDLAFDIENNTLATEGTLPSEGSGHAKKDVIKVIYEVVGKLGLGTVKISEVITQLIGLTTQLSNPPPKITLPTVNPTPATKPEATKTKNSEPTNAPGPVKTDIGATDTKDGGNRPDGTAQELDLTGGKGKGKKKPTHQGADGGEGDVVSGKTDPPKPSEEKDDKKSATYTVPNKKDDKKGANKDVPVSGGDADNKPLTAALSPVTPKTGAVEPTPMVASKAEDADAQRGVLVRIVPVNLQQGETSLGSQPTNAPLLAAAAPTNQSRGNEQAPQPIHPQPAPQVIETRKSREITDHRPAESQAPPLAQQTPQPGERGNSQEFSQRNFAEPQTQFSAQRPEQVGKVWAVDGYGRYYLTNPQAPFTSPIQPNPQGYVIGASAFGSQAPFPPQQTQNSGQIGNPHEFEYDHVGGWKTPFPAQQTQQAGKPWGVGGFGLYYATEPQALPTSQTQPYPRGFDGTPAMQNSETSESTWKPYQPQAQFTDKHTRIAEMALHHSQIPTDERSSYTYPTPPSAYSTHRDQGPSSLPQGRYSQEVLSDSSEDSFSPEPAPVDWNCTRETHHKGKDRVEHSPRYPRETYRKPKDRAGPGERGGHHTQHSRPERSDRDKSDRVSPRLEEFKPSQGQFYQDGYQIRHDQLPIAMSRKPRVNYLDSRRT